MLAVTQDLAFASAAAHETLSLNARDRTAQPGPALWWRR
jgi:hypothetical protein